MVVDEVAGGGGGLGVLVISMRHFPFPFAFRRTGSLLGLTRALLDGATSRWFVGSGDGH